jgi:hypothetical protein
MVKKYVCAKCYEEFLSIEDIVNHMKNSHPEIEDLDAYVDIIELDSREWTDISETVKRMKVPPIAVMPSVPPELVPEGFIRIEDYPYYYKENRYYCKEHRRSFDTENEFLVHILTEHSKDFEQMLKFVVKKSLGQKILEKTTKEQLKDMVDKEIRNWLLKIEEQRPEALSLHVENYFNSLLSFMKGDTEICPICNRLCTINNTLHLEKIFNGLRKVVQLKGKEYYDYLQKLERENKGYQYWMSARYLCQWNGEDIPIKLYPLLHLYLDHPERFESLAGILQGDLIDYLREKKYLKQREVQTPKPIEPVEKLSRGIVIKRKENLSQGEQALLNWLDKERVKKQ